MLKRTIKYEDFNGDEVEEVFYFNISKPELVELEVEYEGGFGKMLSNLIEAKDSKALIKQFKALVLLAHGEKSDDGKHFLKSDESRLRFSQSAAYSALFMELATDDNAAVVFLKGVLPKDMGPSIDTAQLEALPTPPTPPNS